MSISAVLHSICTGRGKWLAFGFNFIASKRRSPNVWRTKKWNEINKILLSLPPFTICFIPENSCYDGNLTQPRMNKNVEWHSTSVKQIVFIHISYIWRKATSFAAICYDWICRTVEFVCRMYLLTIEILPTYLNVMQWRWTHENQLAPPAYTWIDMSSCQRKSSRFLHFAFWVQSCLSPKAGNLAQSTMLFEPKLW